MRQIIGALVCAGAALVLSAGLASAIPQGDAQQKCINNINKTSAKVAATQDGVNTGCSKDFVKGKLTGANAAETCVNADGKGKVQKAKLKVTDTETKSCTAPLPDFGYTSGAAAGIAAGTASVGLLHDVYGNPVDSSLLSCDTFPTECKCQQIVPKRVDGMFRAMSKVFLGCKRSALAIGKDPFPAGAADASELVQCLTNGSIGLSVAADTKGKIGGAAQKLADTVGQFCGMGTQDEFSGGVCATLTGTALSTCLSEHVKCRFCQMVNAVDNLSANCNTFAGTTCP